MFFSSCFVKGIFDTTSSHGIPYIEKCVCVARQAGWWAGWWADGFGVSGVREPVTGGGSNAGQQRPAGEPDRS